MRSRNHRIPLSLLAMLAMLALAGHRAHADEPASLLPQDDTYHGPVDDPRLPAPPEPAAPKDGSVAVRLVEHQADELERTGKVNIVIGALVTGLGIGCFVYVAEHAQPESPPATGPGSGIVNSLSSLSEAEQGAGYALSGIMAAGGVAEMIVGGAQRSKAETLRNQITIAPAPTVDGKGNLGMALSIGGTF